MKTGQQLEFLERLNPRTIEAVWGDHCRRCACCRLWEEDKSATLVHVCPEGLNYVKVILAKHAPKKPREPIVRSVYWASKEQVKALMKYK